MKNPLFKRLPYILKDEIAKYLIIFLFMAGSIGLISGFLVADGSMIKAYNDSFDKYNIEDGHFRLNDSLSKENKKALEKEGVPIYDLNYIEEEVESTSTFVSLNQEIKSIKYVLWMENFLKVKMK